MVSRIILLLAFFGRSVNSERAVFDRLYNRNFQQAKNHLELFPRGRKRIRCRHSILGQDDDERSLLMVSSSRGNQQYSDSPEEAKKSQNPFWPPWPFSLIGTSNGHIKKLDNNQGTADSSSTLLVTYVRQRAKIGLRQLQQVGRALIFHLPPAAPPIVLLAFFPSKQVFLDESISKDFSTKASATIMANSIARRLALASLGVSVISWADYEVRKKKRLTPLPLTIQYQDIQRAVLPPFLPEALPPIEIDPILNKLKEEGRENSNILLDEISDELDKSSLDGETSENTYTIDRMKKNLQNLLKSATNNPEFIRNWRMMKRLREREDEEIKRKTIMNELLAIQELKKRKMASHNKNVKKFQGKKSLLMQPKSLPLGYALVTGASRGIGRAIAIELARYEIPLILVARDIDKLTEVADEVEKCYGVKSCIVSADLSDSGAADRVYEAVNKAGLMVDVLVNNAGVCVKGNLIENEKDDLKKMLDVNVNSVLSLSYLFGRDMKARKRGRILFVSSVAGAVPGSPGVAAYAASKAFEKSLSMSLGKELERFGVGVTLILPGAVKGTAFSGKGQMEEAICWKIPFYAMNAPKIAATSVRGLLSGDAEITPGWHNRCFLKIVVPMIPTRLTTFVAGLAFSTVDDILRLPWARTRVDELLMSDPTQAETLEKWSGNTNPPKRLLIPPKAQKKLSSETKNEIESSSPLHNDVEEKSEEEGAEMQSLPD